MKITYFLTSILLLTTMNPCPSIAVGPQSIPTFEEIRSDEIPPLELYERLKFPEESIQQFILSHDKNSLLAAGIQGDQNQEKIFSSFVALDLEKPIDYISVLNYCFAQENNDREVPPFCDTGKFVQLLLERDPQNSLSYFIAAAFEFRNRDRAKALHLLEVGNKLESFSSYAIDRFSSVSNTAQQIGYSKYPAYLHALGSLVPVSAYIYLMNNTVRANHGIENEKFAREFLKMGHKVESNAKTLLEVFFGLAIQNAAIDLIQDDQFTSEKMAIEKRRASTSDKTLQARETFPSTEIEAIAFFEMFIQHGEPFAIDWLLESQPNKK